MSDFPVHTVETAPGRAKELLAGLQAQIGFVPNLAGTMAGSPALLEAFLSLRSIFAGAALDAATREIVAIAVAFDTGCSYCVAAHSTFAAKAGAEPVQAVRRGDTPSDRRLAALARFARSVARRQADLPERGRELLATGFSPAEVLETLAVIALPMLASSVFQLTGTTLDAVFEPQTWARTA